MLFHTKSRTEQLADHSAHLAGTAASVADQLRERVVPAVGQAAESAKEWGQPRVEAARHWAKPRVEHGIEVAAPRLESAVSGLAPKVDTARDKIVEDLLPRLTEAIAAFAAASTAAKDEAVARGTGAAAVISGGAVASPRRKKKGRMVLLALGLLAVAAAAATAFMKRPAPKDDPWATPLADPYVAPTPGRHFGVAADGDSADADSDAADADADAVAAEAKSVVSDSSEATDGPGPLDLVADVDLTERDDTDEGARA